MSLLVHKCSDLGCLNAAHGGLQLCVPTVDQAPGSPGYLTMTLGVFTCIEHYHEMAQNPQAFIKQVLTAALMVKFMQAARDLNRKQPDFRHTFVELLPMNAPGLKRHERAKTEYGIRPIIFFRNHNSHSNAGVFSASTSA